MYGTKIVHHQPCKLVNSIMSDFEFQSLLNIGIYKKKLNYIDNHKLCKEIKTDSKKIDDSFIKDKNHSYFEDQTYPFDAMESQKLINALKQEISIALGREMLLNNLWVITLEHGQSVGYHSHKLNTHLYPNEHYSIAYYPNVPEGSADIQFNVTACNTIESTISVPIEEGLLIIFNSFIPHMTNRHNNLTENRVVVSANFSPKYPNNRENQDWSGYAR